MGHFEEDGEGREGGIDFLQVFRLGLQVVSPAPVVAAGGGEDSVHDDRVHAIPVELQVGVGAVGFLDHHLFRIHHQANAGDVGIAEDPADDAQSLEQVLQFVVSLVEGDAGGGADRHPKALDRQLLKGEGLGDPPLGDLGKGEEGQGLAGGRAVDDDQVVLAAVEVVVEPEEGGAFAHAGNGGEFFGGNIVDALPLEDQEQQLAHVSPVLFHRIVEIDFLGMEVGDDLDRFGAELHVQGVGQAVGGIGGHHQGAHA